MEEESKHNESQFVKSSIANIKKASDIFSAKGYHYFKFNYESYPETEKGVDRINALSSKIQGSN